MADEKEYRCDCGHIAGFHDQDSCNYVDLEEICNCNITINQLISKEIKAETAAIALQKFGEGRDFAENRLWEFVTGKIDKSADTAFTSGRSRDIAREFERQKYDHARLKKDLEKILKDGVVPHVLVPQVHPAHFCRVENCARERKIEEWRKEGRKAEQERIFDEINTQLHSRLIGTWYCDVHGKSELQYYPCCDKATFDEEGRYDWIWQALDQAKKNLMYSDEPTNKNETEEE